MYITKILAYLLTRCADFSDHQPIMIGNTGNWHVVELADLINQLKAGATKFGYWVINEGVWTSDNPEGYHTSAFKIYTATK